ncbi:unnamed protein product, partial [Trichogramma brassicae]
MFVWFDVIDRYDDSMMYIQVKNRTVRRPSDHNARQAATDRFDSLALLGSGVGAGVRQAYSTSLTERLANSAILRDRLSATACNLGRIVHLIFSTFLFKLRFF